LVCVALSGSRGRSGLPTGGRWNLHGNSKPKSLSCHTETEKIEPCALGRNFQAVCRARARLKIADFPPALHEALGGRGAGHPQGWQRTRFAGERQLLRLAPPLWTGSSESSINMLCQKCHKQEATIHLSGTVAGAGGPWHLCSACAAEELAAKAAGSQVDLSKFLQLLADHVVDALQGNGPEADAEPETAPEVQRTCPGCGLTDVELENGRRLGCARCYEVFADVIAPWLEDLHRDVVHRGLRPGVSRGAAAPRARATLTLDVLRAELEQAIAAEAYERAAELRDAIRNCQQESNP
jgi:protein arginine kinase activator